MTTPEETVAVEGVIVVPDDLAEPQLADVIVQVEDVSRADAPSVVVGEQRQKDVQLVPRASVPFHVEVPKHVIDTAADYSVRVHLDVTRSGNVEIGDYVSTESHPVLSRGYRERMTIGVRRV